MTVPLLSEHDTWLSCDPVVGCPAHCTYCYLQKHGLVHVAPVVRVAPTDAVEAIAQYLADETILAVGPPRTRLVCLGNHTDMLMTPANRAYVLEFARLLHGRRPTLPLVLISKGRLPASFVETLDAIGHRTVLLMSQSFFAWASCGGAAVERGVAAPEETAANLRMISATANLRGLHFWRPLTSVNVPDETAARRQLELIRDAGAIASVAVGLKAGPGLERHIASSGGELLPILGASRDAATPHGEHFDPSLRNMVLRTGRDLGHAVYLNTSCAVSLALEIPEFLGTWRAPIRPTRCDPANCPSLQRARCFEQPSPAIDPDITIRAAAFLGVPAGVVHVTGADRAIVVEGRLAQDTRCRLSHATGLAVQPRDVGRTREWHGAMFPVSASSDEPAEVDLHRAIPWDLVRRLHRVTGMLSPVGRPGDARPAAFSRFLHVRRVASVAAMLAARVRAAGGAADQARVSLLAWCHDLNRWAFAHNAERGLFDQAVDMPRFVAAHSIGLTPTDVCELSAIVTRRAADLSIEGRIVLTADRAVGIHEDLFFALVAFRWPIDALPADEMAPFESALLDPAVGPFVESARRRYDPGPNQDIDQFVAACDTVVTAHAVRLALRHVADEAAMRLHPSFDETMSRGKRTILEQCVFPVTNERVGRGAALRERVIVPLVRRHPGDFVDLLTTMDDGQVLDLAVSEGLIDAAELPGLHADVGFRHGGEST